MSLPADSDSRPTLEGAIQRIVDREGLELKNHPSTERWVEYQEGLLGETEEDELQDHLVVCRVCRAVVLSLAQAAVSSASSGTPESTAEIPSPNVTALPTPLRRPRRSTVLMGWLAAALAMVAMLAGYTMHRREVSLLQHEIGNLSALVQGRAPEFDLTLVEAVPEEVRVRGSEDETLPRLVGGGTLALELPDLSSAGELVLTILASAKSSKAAVVAWSTKVSARDERFGALRLPANSLPPGEYIAKLSGLRGSERTDLATYRFIIESKTATP